jgi:hypothetical protein
MWTDAVDISCDLKPQSRSNAFSYTNERHYLVFWRLQGKARANAFSRSSTCLSTTVRREGWLSISLHFLLATDHLLLLSKLSLSFEAFPIPIVCTDKPQQSSVSSVYIHFILLFLNIASISTSLSSRCEKHGRHQISHLR